MQEVANPVRSTVVVAQHSNEHVVGQQRPLGRSSFAVVLVGQCDCLSGDGVSGKADAARRGRWSKQMKNGAPMDGWRDGGSASGKATFLLLCLWYE